VRDVYKRNYHIVSVYARSGSGPDLGKKFGVRGFPSMAFVDSHGELLCRAFGGFNHGDDALRLDAFVRKVAVDTQSRKELDQRKSCGRLDP